MADVWNPAQAETAIRDLSTQIGHGVNVCNSAYVEYLAADHVFDLAWAHAILAAPGANAEARKAHAVIATETERRDRDDADAAYRYADRRAKALTDQLRAMQSVGASIRQTYEVAGRGEN